MKNKGVKILLIVASCLVVFGCVFTIIGFFSGASLNAYIDNTGLHITPRHNNEKIQEDKITTDMNLEKFNNIELSIDYSDVEIKYGESYGIEIKTNSTYNQTTIDYKIENNTLKIDGNTDGKSTKRWFNFDIRGLFSGEKSIYNSDNKVTIFVPRDAVIDKMDVFSNMGTIVVDGISSNTISLKALFGDVKAINTNSTQATFNLSSGKLTIENSNINNCQIDNSYGDIILTNIISDGFTANCSAGRIKIEDGNIKNANIIDSYGDIDLEGKLESINAQCSMGRVKLSGEISGENILSSDYGNVDIEGTLYGNYDISADMGEIEVSTSLKESEYNLDLSADMGNIKIGDKNERNGAQINNSGAQNNIKAHADMGEINISFEDDDD